MTEPTISSGISSGILRLQQATQTLPSPAASLIKLLPPPFIREGDKVRLRRIKGVGYLIKT